MMGQSFRRWLRFGQADALDRANSALADDIGNSAGGLGAENEMNDGEFGAL